MDRQQMADICIKTAEAINEDNWTQGQYWDINLGLQDMAALLPFREIFGRFARQALPADVKACAVGRAVLVAHEQGYSDWDAEQVAVTLSENGVVSINDVDGIDAVKDRLRHIADRLVDGVTDVRDMADWGDHPITQWNKP